MNTKRGLHCKASEDFSLSELTAWPFVIRGCDLLVYVETFQFLGNVLELKLREGEDIELALCD